MTNQLVILSLSTSLPVHLFLSHIHTLRTMKYKTETIIKYLALKLKGIYRLESSIVAQLFLTVK